MKIILFSDIHTEFIKGSAIKDYLYPMLHADADVCVLAGDIASGRGNVRNVLNIFAKHYSHVIYIAGNHEYYGSDLVTFDSLDNLPKNVHFLNPGFVHICNKEGELVSFIGATLWTNFRNDPFAMIAAKSMISDFRLIKGFSPEIAATRYNRDLEFIQSAYENISNKKVIVTHFLPAVECISPRFRGDNLLNNYFSNDLGDYIATLSNTTWMFGHTHDTMDFFINDTRMVCNPKGYPNEHYNNFDYTKVIDV